MKGTIRTEKENWSLGTSKEKLVSSEIFKFNVESFAKGLFFGGICCPLVTLKSWHNPIIPEKNVFFFNSSADVDFHC